MQKILSYILILFLSLGYAQEKKIILDYTVDYLIPKKNQIDVDTVTVGFDKSGRYIWTNSQFLAKDLARSIFSGKEQLLRDPEIGIILDAKELQVSLFFKSGVNELCMKLALEAIVPVAEPNAAAKEMELIAETTGKSIEILNRKAEVYNVYPSSDSNDSVYFAFDKSLQLNNNNLFNNILGLFFASEENAKMKSLNFPNGLILSVSSKNESIIEAIKINTKAKEITLKNSYKISE